MEAARDFRKKAAYLSISAKRKFGAPGEKEKKFFGASAPTSLNLRLPLPICAYRLTRGANFPLVAPRNLRLPAPRVT